MDSYSKLLSKLVRLSDSTSGLRQGLTFLRNYPNEVRQVRFFYDLTWSPYESGMSFIGRLSKYNNTVRLSTYGQ